MNKGKTAVVAIMLILLAFGAGYFFKAQEPPQLLGNLPQNLTGGATVSAGQFSDLASNYTKLMSDYSYLWTMRQPVTIYLNNGWTKDCRVKIDQYNYDFTLPLLNATNSMYPCIDINTNTMLYFKKTSFADLEVGDVVMFKRIDADVGFYVDTPCTDGVTKAINCYVHRLVIKTDRGFVAKGDNNSYFDEWLVTPENYFGKLVWVN